MASVTCSGAGSPFEALNFTPKSPSAPPGLWLAESMIPPQTPYLRMTHEAAGVDRMPPRPTMTRPNLFPAAILRMVWTASRL